jgi:hypothetical protein
MLISGLLTAAEASSYVPVCCCLFVWRSEYCEMLLLASSRLLVCWTVGLLDCRSVGLDCNWNDFNDMIFRYCF